MIKAINLNQHTFKASIHGCLDIYYYNPVRTNKYGAVEHLYTEPPILAVVPKIGPIEQPALVWIKAKEAWDSQRDEDLMLCLAYEQFCRQASYRESDLEHLMSAEYGQLVEQYVLSHAARHAFMDRCPTVTSHEAHTQTPRGPRAWKRLT